MGPNPQPVVRFLFIYLFFIFIYLFIFHFYLFIYFSFLFIYLFLLTSIINERGWVILWVKGGLRSFSTGLLIVPKVPNTFDVREQPHPNSLPLGRRCVGLLALG